MQGMLVDKRNYHGYDEGLERPEIDTRFERPRNGALWLFNKEGRYNKIGPYRLMVVEHREEERAANMQRSIISTGQHCALAIDFTTMPLSPLHRLSQVGMFNPKDMALLERNIQVNYGKGRKVNDLLGTDTRDTCIILATGPSLRETAKLVKNIDRSKVAIIALNSATMAVGPENVDYHFCIDRRIKPEWSLGCENVIGVFHPSAGPEAIAMPYKERYFFGQPGEGVVPSMMRSKYQGWLTYVDGEENVAEIETGGNVGPSSVQFAYMMGFKRILFVGLDVSWNVELDLDSRMAREALKNVTPFTPQWEAIVKRLQENTTHWQANVNDVQYDAGTRIMNFRIGNDELGNPLYESCHVKDEYHAAFKYTLGYSWFMLQKGVEMFNCTGSGAYWKHELVHCPPLNSERPDIYGNLREQSSFPSYTLKEVADTFNLWRQNA